MTELHEMDSRPNFPAAPPLRRAAAARAAMALLAFCLTAGVAARDAHAGGSSPVLALTSADVATAPSGPVALHAEGAFSFDDVVEDVFGLSLVVTHGTHWVRYEQDGTVREGDSAAVADGLVLSEVAAFLALPGTGAVSPARLDGITRAGVTVVLPAGFPSGDATVVLAAVFDGDSFLSNALAVSVP
jgi:hypothetical protein